MSDDMHYDLNERLLDLLGSFHYVVKVSDEFPFDMKPEDARAFFIEFWTLMVQAAQNGFELSFDETESRHEPYEASNFDYKIKDHIRWLERFNQLELGFALCFNVNIKEGRKHLYCKASIKKLGDVYNYQVTANLTGEIKQDYVISLNEVRSILDSSGNVEAVMPEPKGKTNEQN